MSKMLEHILLQTEANVKLLNITGIRKAQVKTRGSQLISVKNGDTNTELVLRAGPAGSNQLGLQLANLVTMNKDLSFLSKLCM